MKLHGNGRANGWSKTGQSNRSPRWVTLAALGVASALIIGATRARADDDEYNFSWLDPEKKIYVLQNRKYQKAGRAMASLMLGIGWSNPYRSTFNLDPRIGFYFTETLGIEGFYEMVSNSENSTFEALKASTSSSTIPLVREITGQMGFLLHWAPWYAKINVFNQILYFDWYFDGGVGSIKARFDTNTVASQSPRYQDENLFAIFVGTGHQYHLSQNFFARLDVLASFYSAQTVRTSGDKKMFSNYNFTAGIGFRL
jgi:outer membrane beta-barrel protein